MKHLFKVILCLSYFALTLQSQAADSSAFFKDAEIIKKVTKELLGPKVKYELKFNESDQTFVESDGTHKFFIHIGKKTYDDNGPGEGSLVLTCHELGHAARGTKEGVANEEDADYWATKVCMPKMLKHFPNKKSEATTPLDNDFKKACDKFSSQEDKEICFRSLRGSYFFDEPFYGSLCSSQKLYLKTTEKELSSTPFKGKRPPNIMQCSFNNLTAGALKLKQPTCYNLVFSRFSLFASDCSLQNEEEYHKQFGVEADDITEESAISNTSRSSKPTIDDAATSQSASSQTSSK